MRNIQSPVTLALATLAFFLLTPAPALGGSKAQDAQDDARFAALAQKAMTQAGLIQAETAAPEDGLTACLKFGDEDALAARQAQWQAAIALMATDAPELVNKWISGQIKPPDVIVRLPEHQLECMVSDMLHGAGAKDAELRLDLYDPSDATHWSQAKWSREFDRSQKVRKRAMLRLVHSHHRDAQSQAAIWHKKYTFPLSMRAFHRVSSDASKACSLSVEKSWRPGDARHQKCWKKVLTPPQRQREIMVASSAPGISRHHWGTDFDLFGLQPYHFLKDGPLWDEYQWMQAHGLEHGFFQPFVGPEKLGPYTYMEERWHWSYSPLAGALTDYMEKHSQQVQKTLETLWAGLETSWSGQAEEKPDLFSFVKDHWHFYSFRIAPARLP